MQSTNCMLFTFLELKTFSLNTRCDADRWILTKDLKVVCLECIIQTSAKSIFFYGYPLKNLNNYFTKPVASSSLQIFASCLEKSEQKIFSVDKLFYKMVKIEFKREDEDENGMQTENVKTVFFPLIHTIL